MNTYVWNTSLELELPRMLINIPANNKLEAIEKAKNLVSLLKDAGKIMEFIEKEEPMILPLAPSIVLGLK